MPSGLIVGDGDSIVVGFGVTTGFFAKAQTDLAYGAGMTWTNVATNGYRTDQLIARASATVDALKGAGPTNIVLVYEMINDMAQGQSAAIHVFNRMRRYCGERKSKGWTVIVCTMMPAFTLSDHGLESQRTALNTLIRNWYKSFADGLADFANDAQMGLEANVYPTPNTTYFQIDGLHPSQGGHDRLATIAESAISALAT